MGAVGCQAARSATDGLITSKRCRARITTSMREAFAEEVHLSRAAQRQPATPGRGKRGCKLWAHGRYAG